MCKTKCKCADKDKKIKNLEKMIREYKKIIEQQDRTIKKLRKRDNYETTPENELHIYYDEFNIEEGYNYNKKEDVECGSL